MPFRLNGLVSNVSPPVIYKNNSILLMIPSTVKLIDRKFVLDEQDEKVGDKLGKLQVVSHLIFVVVKRMFYSTCSYVFLCLLYRASDFYQAPLSDHSMLGSFHSKMRYLN